MTQKRIAFLERLLTFIGIPSDRLHLQWVSSSEAPQFAEAVSGFTERVRELGPSPFRKQWEKSLCSEGVWRV